MTLPTMTRAALFAFLVSACAAKPYQASFNSPLLEPSGPTEMAKNGVAVAIEPITRENVLQFPDVVRQATWREPDPGAQHPLPYSGANPSAPAQLQMVPRSGIVPLVPLPAFRVRISNRSKQATSFSPDGIQLEDNLHRKYSPIVDSVSLRGRFIRQMYGTNNYIANDQSMMRPFINAIDELPLLNDAVTIPPGGNWMGYAVFETGAFGPDEYNAWMNSLQSFALRLNLFDQRGDGSELAFQLDKQNKLVSLTCPSEAKLPSLEKCSRGDDPAMTRGLTRPEGQR